MRKFIGLLLLLLPVLYVSAAPNAGDFWHYHDGPYTFRFGNHIDTHQETRLQMRGRNQGDLFGRFYVYDTGETLADGTPILKHCTTEEHYEAGCVSGWKLEAKPCIEAVDGCRATFLYHDGDHPVWLVGERAMLVQPGSYTHFHWLTGNEDSSLAEVEAVFGVEIDVPAGCNVRMASQLAEGVSCPGYYLQITARAPFGLNRWAFRHGGEDLVLRPGVDNMTHLNLLASYVGQ